MKVSDYLARFLKRSGVSYVFQIIGGASVHMVNSIAETPGIDYVCVQHEQVGAMAADAYSRMRKGNLGAAMGTSGPGITNLITGIANAYFDSTPAIYIAGQVNTFETKQGRNVRQVGFQETEVVSVVEDLTKFAVRVEDPNLIRYYLEKAVFLAHHGRPGPVMLDIPNNVQRASVTVSKLKRFDPKEVRIQKDSKPVVTKNVTRAVRLLARAKRPVIIAGGGIRYAHQIDAFEKLVDALGIPVVATWSGIDVLHHDHKLYMGQIGVMGSRAANFLIQNSDCFMSFGTRLDTRITGGKPDTFAREAKKIVVDIDKGELYKRRGLTPTVGICADVRDVIPRVIAEAKKVSFSDITPWIDQARAWHEQYPAVLPEWKSQKKDVNPYHFVRTLSQMLPNNAVVATDCGANLTWTIQAFHVKRGQRLFSPMGNSPMGNSLGEAIGASFGIGKKDVVCLTGDGGLQVNIQDLQTIVTYNLPVKIFIQNNHRYGIIMQYQDNYFHSQYEGTTPKSGYKVPDFLKIARAYGIATARIRNHKEMQRVIKKVLAHKGPIICDVIHPIDSKIIPRVAFPRPIEDMLPPLPRKEFLENMMVKPLPASR